MEISEREMENLIKHRIAYIILDWKTRGVTECGSNTAGKVAVEIMVTLENEFHYERRADS